MKLSEKGFEKLYEFFMSGKYFDATKCDQIEFEPDDFQDAVILTVEEAKQVKVFLDDAVELHDKGVVVIQSSGFETIHLIIERIKKAEKSK